MTMQDTYIPEWWTATTLGKVIIKVQDKINISELNKWNYISTENMLPNMGWITEAATLPTISSVSKFLIGDILFSNIRTYFKKLWFSNKEGGASNDVLIFRWDEKVIIKDFLYYLLSDNAFFDYTVKTSKGTKMPRWDKDAIAKYPILLPSIPEQKEIASILSSFDSKIELLHRQNATLEKTAQTIFQEWFGKYSVDDELPEGWVFDKMETLIWELEAGRRPKWWVWEIKSWIPSIWAENVKGLLTSNFSNVKFIPESFYASMNVWKIKDNDILIYKDGWAPWEFRPNFTIIGGWYPFNEWAINEHVFRLQAKKDFQQYYLFFWLTWRISIWELKSIWGKAAIPWINGTDFKNLTLLIPEEVILKKFHDCIKPLIKKVLWNNLQIQNLSWSRDTLLPKLMNGEIRV